MATRRSARISAASATKSTADPPPAPVPKGRKRKAATSEASKQGVSNGSLKEVEEGESKAAPATPPRKRRARKPADPPPATPTPSNVQLIGEPVHAHETPKPKPAAVRKLADPNATNATLLSPGSSRIVARNVSPSKAQATTGSILEEACRHLVSVDARMRPLVEKHHCRVFSPEGLGEQVDPFESLCSGIISQQVSGAAAKAIKQRFVDLFADESNGKKFPSPSHVAACTIERLRTAGLSQRKAEYVQGLAEKFVSGELSTQLLVDAPYDVVLEKLIAVRGLGQWSVEMFACFGLKRMDVFSLGDLGVQRGMAAFVGRDVAKLKNKGGKWKYMSESEMKEISEKFAPYRSVFMWYMWRVEETDVSTME